MAHAPKLIAETFQPVRPSSRYSTLLSSPINCSTRHSKFRQRQPLLVLIFAAAITVSCFTFFVRFKEEYLDEAFFGIKPHRQVGGIIKLNDQTATPSGFQGRCICYKPAVGDEDARRKPEVTSFRDGEAVNVVAAFYFRDRHDLVISWVLASEGANDIWESAENRTVAA